MTDLTIRLDQLDALAGLLPETTPPRAVAEIARWGVDLAAVAGSLATDEVESEETIPEVMKPFVGAFLEVGSKMSEHMAWLTARAAQGAAGAPAVHAEDSAHSPAKAADAPMPPQLAEKVSPAASPAEDAQSTAPVSDGGRDEEATAEAAAPPRESHDHGDGSESQSEPPTKGGAWTPAEDAQLRQMKAAGRSVVEIAEALGRTRHSVVWRTRQHITREDTAKKTPPVPAKAAKAPAGAPAGVDAILKAMAELDDSFEPIDDRTLVEQRYVGAGFPGIAEALGCDEDTAKARWRAILKCRVQNKGGILTQKGWADLRVAVARRAAEAEV